MLKKSLSILVIVVMLLSAFTALSFTASAGEIDIAEVAGDDYPYRGGAIDAVDQWKFYTRECTSFCAWRLNNNNGVAFTNWYGGVRWGNAGNWGYAAQSIGITVDMNPALGAIAWWSGGHVAWVSGVNGDNIDIEEYNYSYNHSYNSRTINRYNVTGYIHIKDINPTPQGHVMSEAEGAGRTIPDGDYWICNKIAEDYYVDIPGNDFNTTNKQNLQTWKWSSGLPPIYDVFHFTYLNNGFYKITQINTSMAIDVYGGYLEQGSNVSMWTWSGSTAQQWSIEKTDGGYKIRSRGNNYYMDICDGKNESGTNILTWKGHDGNNQLFSFIPYAPDERPISDGIYAIGSAVKDTCYLDAAGVSGEYKDKSNVQIWNNDDDQFQIEYAGNGYYQISEVTSRLMLDVNNDGELSYLTCGRNVILFSKNGRKNQLWKITKDSDGTYFFVNQMSGYYLDLEHAKTDNGTNVSQYQYNGYKNQRWILYRVLQDDMVTVSDVKITRGDTVIDPQVIVKVDSKSLTQNTDYTVTTEVDMANGSGTVTVTGKGSYCGSVTKEFHISELPILGDADGDGEVTSVDVTYVQRYNAALQTGNDEAVLMNADVDGNGLLEIIDATFIQRHLAKIETPYDIGNAK